MTVKPNPILVVLEQALLNLGEGQDFPQCVGTAAMTVAFQLTGELTGHGLEKAFLSIPDRATGLRNIAMDHIAAANSGIIEAGGLSPAIARFQNTETVIQIRVVLPFELLTEAALVRAELDQLHDSGGWDARTMAPHILSQLVTKARRRAAFRRPHSTRVEFTYADPILSNTPLHRFEVTPQHATGLMFTLVEDKS